MNMLVFTVSALLLVAAPVAVLGDAAAPPAGPVTIDAPQNATANVPTAEITIVRPAGNDNVSLSYVMAEFGTIPYGHNVRFVAVEPTGTIGRAAANSGCVPINDTNVDLGPLTQITIMVLDAENSETASCTDLTRARNAAAAGASGVLLIGGASDTVPLDLTPRIQPLQDDLESIETLSVPVGRISDEQGRTLRSILAAAAENTQATQINIDFTNLIAKRDAAIVEIWHDVSDVCGGLCDLNTEFLTEIADQEVGRDDPKFFVRPRFIFQNCTGEGSEECENSCTANGRYCHTKDVYLSRQGRQVAEEQIRQACLWDVLTDGQEAAASKMWWDYKRTFFRRCHLDNSFGNGFDSACSIQVTRNINLSDEDATAWEACWKDINSTDASMVIEPAERDLTARVEENVAWYLKTFVTVNTRHYHGLFDKEHVYRAACQGMHIPSSDPICGSEAAAGFCAPGTASDLRCRDEEHVKAEKTVCYDGSAGNFTSGCHCNAGWQPEDGLEAEAARGTEQEGTCVDLNECDVDSIADDPCLVRDTPDADLPRAACVNLQGSFDCFAVADACVQDASFDCWISQDGSVNACKDNFEAIRTAGREYTGSDDDWQAELSMIEVSTCDCAAAGCFEGDGETECVESCSPEECSPEGTCPSDPDTTGRNAGIGIAVALLVLAAIVGAAFCLKRRKADREVLKKQASAYNEFRDGADGDEMQRSSTVATGGLDDSKGTMRAASVSAYVRDATSADALEAA